MKLRLLESRSLSRYPRWLKLSKQAPDGSRACLTTSTQHAVYCKCAERQEMQRDRLIRTRTQVKDLIQSDSNAIGFNDVFERDVRGTVEKCLSSFKQLENDLHDANGQIASKQTGNARIMLSASEHARWPFIQPRLDIVRSNLKSAKTNMHLILMTATLALAIKLTSS